MLEVLEEEYSRILKNIIISHILYQKQVCFYIICSLSLNFVVLYCAGMRSVYTVF